MNFIPHDYQAYAIRYIEKHPVAAVLLDMGLGKTVISLTAVFDLLFDSFEVSRVLVVAPLRVARDTWPAEIQKWSHLTGLTYAVAVGTAKERRAALMQNADITIINRENLQWLIDESGFLFEDRQQAIDDRGLVGGVDDHGRVLGQDRRAQGRRGGKCESHADECSFCNTHNFLLYSHDQFLIG